MLHELPRLINRYRRWLKVSIRDKIANYSKESGNKRNVHMVLKGATMSHWWKLLSKFLSQQAQLPPRWKNGRTLPVYILCFYKWSGIGRDGFQAASGSGEHACVGIGLRTTASYCDISSRSEDYTPGGWACPVVTLTKKKSTQRCGVVFKVGHHWQGKAGLLYVIYYNILPINTAYILRLQDNVYNLPWPNIKWLIYLILYPSHSLYPFIFWNG